MQPAAAAVPRPVPPDAAAPSAAARCPLHARPLARIRSRPSGVAYRGAGWRLRSGSIVGGRYGVGGPSWPPSGPRRLRPPARLLRGAGIAAAGKSAAPPGPALRGPCRRRHCRCGEARRGDRLVCEGARGGAGDALGGRGAGRPARGPALPCAERKHLACVCHRPSAYQVVARGTSVPYPVDDYPTRGMINLVHYPVGKLVYVDRAHAC